MPLLRAVQSCLCWQPQLSSSRAEPEHFHPQPISAAIPVPPWGDPSCSLRGSHKDTRAKLLTKLEKSCSASSPIRCWPLAEASVRSFHLPHAGCCLGKGFSSAPLPALLPPSTGAPQHPGEKAATLQREMGLGKNPQLTKHWKITFSSVLPTLSIMFCNRVVQIRSALLWLLQTGLGPEAIFKW